MQAGRIRLPHSAYPTIAETRRASRDRPRDLVFSKRFFQITVDVVMPLALAAFLIAIFVAESTGAFLSATMIGDSLHRHLLLVA